MKKFVFRFQALLDTKKHFEEKYENELALMMRKQHDEEVRLEEMEQRLIRCREEHVNNTETTIEEICRYRNYFDKLHNDIERQVETIDKAAEEVEAKREKLIEVRKEKLALEKLMEKDYRKYQEDMMMWERKFLDEIGTIGYIRRGSGETIY